MLVQLGRQRRAARLLASQVEHSSRGHTSALLEQSSSAAIAGPSTRRRGYASSSNPAQSPASATMRQPRSLSRQQPSSASRSSSVSQSVFSRAAPMVLLPTPLPPDESSAKDAYHFPRSSYLETRNIIDACMFRGHDMPRAHNLFDGLRKSAAEDPDGVANVDVGLYNQFIVTYFDLATASEDVEKRQKSVSKAWQVWNNLVEDGVQPDQMTYASLLLLSARFAPSSTRAVPASTHEYTFSHLLNSMHRKSISVPQTVERLLAYFDVESAERALLISSVQEWAVAEGHPKVLSELANMIESSEGSEGDANIGAGGPVDPVADLPSISPVVRTRVGALPWQKEKILEASDPETPFNLDALRTSMSEIVSARRHLASSPLARQKLVEEAAIEEARERLLHDFERLEAQGMNNFAPMNKKRTVKQWMWDWYQALTPRLEEEIDKIIHADQGPKAGRLDKQLIAPFMTLLKPHQLAMITIMEILRLHGTGGVSEGMKTARALIAVGSAVESEYTAIVRKREMNKRNNLERVYERDESKRSLANPESSEALETAGGLDVVEARRRAAKQDAKIEASHMPEWSRAIQARIGGILVDALMDTAVVVRTIDHPVTGEPYSETQPAFNHEYEYIRGKKLGVIKLNPEVAREFTSKEIHEGAATLHPRHLPMFVPPRPWVGHSSGAYFYNRSNVMRIKDSIEQHQYLREAAANGNLELVFSSLDVLGSTPWVVNEPVFRVVLDVWNSGKGEADIPPAELAVPDPVKPDDYDTNDVSKKNYLAELKDVINKRRNNHSERCSVNYKLEIARAFLPDKFYFPHNLDFRGRAYPIPPNLNHIGDDLSRGLLKLADKRPLGVSGLRWLKIHLANVCGFDKASFDEREQWTMNHLDEIRDSAAQPLDGKRWWMQSDDPWQTLATCNELTEALKLDDPTTFESNLPVHQDGTCNGLQHYAALGGDSVGAKQVNLDVTDRPSDVYTYVARMVDEVIAKDVEKGDKIAKMLVGRVARKTVKQTVMTTVYGVTFVGARAQIEKQLRTAGDLNRDELWQCSTYLARATLNCIADLFSGAKAIQTWLSTVARLVAKSIPPTRISRSLEPSTATRSKSSSPASNRISTEQMSSVIWTTPMGLPIVQPYRKIKKRQLTTPVQSVFIADPNLQNQVNPQKQSSAFPPNFIHSLDATHMMLTALECRREEITFASVHDSYWTHACSVDRMSEIIRDTFVHLHSSDIMGKLLEEFRERYRDYEVPIISLNAKEIDYINTHTNTRIQVKPGRNGAVRKSKSRSAKAVISASSEETAVSEAEDADAADPTTLEAQLAADPDAVVEVSSPSMAKEDGEKKTVVPLKAYVKLTDILPPLPAKGDFTVETIKKSLYFFS